MQTIKFTVDAALLRELGERLVGRPHIALAELIKNSYDADATAVSIEVEPEQIVVADNGSGMNFDTFRDFWMRIGSPHKQVQATSPQLNRPLTGSKGVGRLAAQFLAQELEITTVSSSDNSTELVARVDWSKAIAAGELTEATATWQQRANTSDYPGASKSGTRIILKGLNQQWGPEEFKDLAGEIWVLQPPFRGDGGGGKFAVDLVSRDEEITSSYRKQRDAILDIWYARLTGKLTRSEGAPETAGAEVRILVEFSDGTKIPQRYPIPDCPLHELEFEIRIYHLERRQPRGIKVGEARDYLKSFGGVRIYDAGFQLPYYGKESDWLDIEADHAHRLGRSELLPDELQASHGLNALPTNSRILGVVRVDTAKEQREMAPEHQPDRQLMIQVTRDRLVDNRAFRGLRDAVRWALDFYATQETSRVTARTEEGRPTEPLTAKVERVEAVLERHRDRIEPQVYGVLAEEIADVIKASESEAEAFAAQVGLLGALATAGISAIAYEHEVSKQLPALRAAADAIESTAGGSGSHAADLKRIAKDVRDWISRAEGSRELFAPIMDEQARTLAVRLKSRAVIDGIAERTAVVMPGVTVDARGIAADLLLPPARLAEWNAIFQNVFLNAANAMLDTTAKLISVRSDKRGQERSILVVDTGRGVDLKTAEDLFKPFRRRTELSPERRALGLGGTGLGLTIVRMISGSLGCTVAFVSPPEGFETAFKLTWRESNARSHM